MNQQGDNTTHGASTCLACPSCDLMFDVSQLKPGEVARCSRCRHFLTRYLSNELERVTALAIAALVFLIMACSFPFLAFNANGLESAMTLPETVLKLWSYDRYALAALVSAFIITIPAILLSLILLITVSLLLNRHSTWLPHLGRLIYILQEWSMVEVFFIGVLVSLVKISKMATVVIGMSFWAYAVFALLFVLAISSLDRVQCWRRIEALNKP